MNQFTDVVQLMRISWTGKMKYLREGRQGLSLFPEFQVQIRRTDQHLAFCFIASDYSSISKDGSNVLGKSSQDQRGVRTLCFFFFSCFYI